MFLLDCGATMRRVYSHTTLRVAIAKRPTRLGSRISIILHIEIVQSILKSDHEIASDEHVNVFLVPMKSGIYEHLHLVMRQRYLG